MGRDNDDDSDNNDNSDNKERSEEDEKLIITCCVHGKPCQLADSKKRQQQQQQAKKSGYESLRDLEPDLNSSRADNDDEDIITNREESRLHEELRPSSQNNRSSYENITDEKAANLGKGEGEIPDRVVSKSVITDDWDSSEDLVQSNGNGGNAEGEYENVDKIKPGASISTDKESSRRKPKDVAAASASKNDKPSVERSKSEEEMIEKQRKGNQRTPSGCRRQTFGCRLTSQTEVTRSDRNVTRSDRSLTTTDSADRLDQDRVNPKEQLLEFYMGFRTRAEAEKYTPRGFRLYHLVDYRDDDFLQSTLSLFIVYRATGGDYRHIRVRRSGKDYLTVDIEGEPHFQSLSQLITFYDIYASLDNNMEPFPNRRCLDDNGNATSSSGRSK